MPKLSFRVDTDTSPVKEFRTEIEQIEKTMLRIKGENFSFDHWLKEFERLKCELKKKCAQIDSIKKDILSVNPITNRKKFDSLNTELSKSSKEHDALIDNTIALSSKFSKAYDDLVATLGKAQKVTDEVTAKFIEQKQVVTNLQSEVSSLNAEYRNADNADKVGIRSQITSKQQELEQERITLNALKAEQERARLSIKGLSDETRNYEKVVGKVSGAQAEAYLVMGRFEQTLLKIGGLATYEITGISEEIQEYLDKVAGKEGGWFDVTNRAVEGYIKNIIQAKNVTGEIDKKARERFGISDNYTPEKKDSKEEEKKTSTEWLASSKQVMSDVDRDKELKRLKGLRDSAKATYEVKGGSVSSETKQESEVEKLREQQEKYNLLFDKKRREQEQMEIDSQHELEQVEINGLQEGGEKVIRQRKLNHEKELEAIKREAEEKKLKLIEKAQAEFEANPANANKSFDAESFIKSKSVQKEFKKIEEIRKVKIQTSDMKYNRGDDLKELFNQYQSYTDQRLAIEKKYNDDIAILQEARKKAEGNIDEVAKIDHSIAKATVEKGKELMKHDFDVLKQSREYIRAFEDLKNASSETLQSLLQQFENAKSTTTTVLNPEDLREYTTTIQKIIDELDNRNPFQALADRQKELAEAEQELAEAKKQLDAVNRGAKIVTGVRSISLDEDGKIKVENIYLTATEALNKYNAAKDKTHKANNNFIKAEKTAMEKINELADSIKGLGDAIGGQAGEIISLMGDVALFATGTINGISKVAQTGANAISTVEKVSVILGTISTAIQLLQKIGKLGNNKAFKQYEAYAEKVKEINALAEAVNQYRIAALEAQQAESNWFSTDNLKNLRDYKSLHDEVYKSYVDKARESQAIYKNESGGGWLTGAINWVMGNLSALSWWNDWKNIWGQGDYGKGQTAAINNLRIETRKKSSGFLGTGIGGKSQKTEDLVTWVKNQGFGDLFDDEGLINKELAQSLIDNYSNKLVGQTKETLEALIKLREQYNEYIEQLHEYVSSLYEPLVDNFVDSLWDWFNNGKDALKSFKDYASDTFRDIVSDMMRTIVLDKVVGSFSDDIAALYEEYAKGAINETELIKKVTERTGGLVDNYEQNIPTLQSIMEQVNSYLQSVDINLTQSDSISQSSTTGSFQTMSQDTGEELNGRFAALQIAGEEIKNQSTFQTQSLNFLTVKTDALISVNTETKNIADETRHLIAQSYLELVRISENTGAIVKPIQQMQKDIAEVKKNTSKL